MNTQLTKQSQDIDPIQVAVVDNQLTHLMRLSLFLEHHETISIIGTAKDGLTALKVIEKEEPDIVLLTVEVMPVIGIAVLHLMTQLSKVIILNWDKEHETWPQISLSDIKGYVDTGADLAEIEQAIFAVFQGKFYISRVLRKTLLGSKLKATNGLPTRNGVSASPPASQSAFLAPPLFSKPYSPSTFLKSEELQWTSLASPGLADSQSQFIGSKSEEFQSAVRIPPALTESPSASIFPRSEEFPSAITTDPVRGKPAKRWPTLVLASLAAIALIILGVLIRKILLPSFDDPNSKAYSTSLGYPTVQRLLGQPIQVSTVKVEAQAVADGVSAQGEAVALRAVQVSSLSTGQVSQVQVSEGDRVRKGQILFRLKRQPFEQSVTAAETQIAIAQEELSNLTKLNPNVRRQLQKQVKNAQGRIKIAEGQLAKLQRLADQGAISKSQILDQEDIVAQRRQELILAEQELAQHQSGTATDRTSSLQTIAENIEQLGEARRNLENTVVSSPIGGLVTELTVNSGEVVSPDAPVLTVSQNIVFKVDIDQTKIEAVQVGDAATVRLVSYPGKTYTGTVIQVNPTVATAKPTTGSSTQPSGQKSQYTYPVWVKIPQLQLTPGLQGYAQLGRSQSRLLIPEQAITHLSAGEGLVMAAINGKAVVKSVKLGKVWGNQREVSAGLSAGDSIVLSPQALEPNDDIIAEPVTLSDEEE